MSTLTYNDINLEPIKTRVFSRQPIYKGPDYLYTRYKLNVRALFSPGATSYGSKFAQQSATYEKGFSATHTDLSIRHLLMQPRKKLVYTSGWYDPRGRAVTERNPVARVAGPNRIRVRFARRNDRVILESPPPPFQVANKIWTTDANNGPMPLDCTVVRIDGTNTFVVDYVVQTDVNENYLYADGAPPVLLSNRWSMSADIDRDHFTTRRVQGTAVFRTDRMLALQAAPDSFREELGHPIPKGFRRENISVRLSEENNTLFYSFVDREMSHNIVVEGVSRIEGFCTVGQSIPGAEAAAWKGARAVGNAFAMEFGQVVDDVKGLLPTSAINLVARVWGTRSSTRRNLVAVASRVLVAALPDLEKPQRFIYSRDLSTTVDLFGRYAEARASLHTGPFTETALGAINSFELARRYPEMFRDDELKGINKSAPAVDATNPQGRNGTAGTYIGAVVAQALHEDGQLPADPPVIPARAIIQNLQ